MRADIEQALSEYGSKIPFTHKKAMAQLEELIGADEQVLYVAASNVKVKAGTNWRKDTLAGVVALTDKRVVIHSKILNQEETDNIDLRDVQSVDCAGDGLTGGHIRVQTTTKHYDIQVTYKKDVMRKIADTFNQAVAACRSGGAPDQTVASSGGQVDALGQIEKLAELRDKGILTEDEFNTKKAELLAKL